MFKIEEEALQAHKGVNFSKDHKALVLWLLQDKNDSQTQEKLDKARSLMIYRVGETSGEKAAQMAKWVVDFNLQVAIKEKEKLDAVNLRLEVALEAYEEKRKEVNERDSLIWKLRK